MNRYLLEVFLQKEKIHSFDISSDEVWMNEEENYVTYSFRTDYSNKRKTDTYQIPASYIAILTSERCRE